MKLRRFSAFFLVGFFVVLLSILFSSKPASSEWWNDLLAPTTSPVTTVSPIELRCLDNPTYPAGVATGCDFTRYKYLTSVTPSCPVVSATTYTTEYPNLYPYTTPPTGLTPPDNIVQICFFSKDVAGNFERAKSLLLTGGATPTIPPPTIPPTPTPTPTTVPPTNTPVPTNTPIPTPTIPFSKWFQGQGGDMRMDSVFEDRITADVTPKLETSIKSFTVGAIEYSLTHGVIFSGLTPIINYGKLSEKEWLVMGTPYDSRLKRTTSYDHINNLDITKTSINCAAAPGCNFNNFASGVYTKDGDLTLSAVSGNSRITIPGRTIVLISSGDITINSNITLQAGAFFLVSAKGKITVAGNVTYLVGFYSADKEFKVENPSSGPRQVLTIEGLVVANAGGTSSSFLSLREIPTVTLPAVELIERPDLILSTPEFLRIPNYIWQEVAP